MSNIPVDSLCYLSQSGGTVVDDYNAMLNQTNIGGGLNNNKFYVIQVIQDGAGKFYTWNRWGRVGEPGQNKLAGPVASKQEAVKLFVKKFKEKTKNDWDDRANFVKHAGKYELLEMDYTDDDGNDAATPTAAAAGPTPKIAESKLHPDVQALCRLIFDQKMFSNAMQEFKIDTKKMPLGKLSLKTIQAGFKVLETIEKKLDGKKPAVKESYAELSSQFYTVFPSNFGRATPPVINTKLMLREKMDMLNVLMDVEKAQGLLSKAGKSSGAKRKAASTKKKQPESQPLLPNPIDKQYETLEADIEPVNPKSAEYKVIEKYLRETEVAAAQKKGGGRKLHLKHVFSVCRHSEPQRFKAHDKLGNRKLLWHGTAVPVVAAILNSGLRIMPHSGGRVGKGIYFASENAKSAGYVRRAGNTGIMFLAEVALGKEHSITQDDWTLKAPPKGHDSVVARGNQEPCPTKDTTITIDGKSVTVPQGKAVPQKQYSHSSFWNSEYLIYKESQCHLRYILVLDW